MHVVNGFGDLVSYVSAEDSLKLQTKTALAMLGSVADWRVEQMLAWQIVDNIPRSLRAQIRINDACLTSMIWPSADIAERVAAWLTYQSLRLYPTLRRPRVPEEGGLSDRFSAFYEATSFGAPFVADQSSLTAPNIPETMDIEHALHMELPSWSERHDAIDHCEIQLVLHRQSVVGSKGNGVLSDADKEHLKQVVAKKQMVTITKKAKYGN